MERALYITESGKEAIIHCGNCYLPDHIFVQGESTVNDDWVYLDCFCDNCNLPFQIRDYSHT